MYECVGGESAYIHMIRMEGGAGNSKGRRRAHDGWELVELGKSLVWKGAFERKSMSPGHSKFFSMK